MTDLQTYGALLVFGAFAGAVAAPRLLDVCPGSAFAWYLHLDFFRIFGTLRLRTSPLEPLFGAYGLAIDAGLIAAVIAARALRARIVTAFLANLSFAAVVALLYCRFAPPAGTNVSPIAFERLSLTESLFGAVLLATSLLAFLASHAAFIVEVVREWCLSRRTVSGPALPFGAVLPSA